MVIQIGKGRAAPAAGVVVVAVLLLLAWKIVYDTELVSNLIVPSPGQTWDAFWEGLVETGTFWPHVRATALATLAAFVIGTVVGVLLGTLFAFVPLARKSLYPYVIVGMSFPKIAVAPLFVLWFGYGLSSKIAVGAAIAFFPVLTSTAAGLTEITKDEIELFRSWRATRVQELRFLRAPRAVSYVLPSLDLAIIGALLGVIAGEFISATEGLGFLMQRYSQIGDARNVFALLFCMAAVGLAFKGATVLVARLQPKNAA